MSATDAATEAQVRRALTSARRIVIKIGSASLTQAGADIAVPQIAKTRIAELVQQVHQLLDADLEVVIVSSGAVAAGSQQLGWQRQPSAVHDLQAAAAIGQVRLLAAYESAFAEQHRHAASVLLTHDDLADRERYLNARTTLLRLLSLGVTPVINENDTVATDEIRFGDNDTLAGLVTNLIQADVLLLLTDIEGLYELDPRESDDAELISFARAGDPGLKGMAGEAGQFGRGGMVTKLDSAEIAARSGAHTVIASSRAPDVVRRVLAGDAIGTLLAAEVAPLDARKRWIAGQLRAKGTLMLDPGAVRALLQGAGSLLSVGVTSVTGTFGRGDVVALQDAASGAVVGQGLVNYSSEEARQLVGVASAEIAQRLGYANEPELVHRDNLVLA